MTSQLRERFSSIRHRGQAPVDLELAVGDMEDYKRLSEYHYRARRPATATRVLVLKRTTHSPGMRFQGLAPQRCAVAVLVESLPSLSCRLRNYALDDRYGGWLPVQQRAKLLNREMRVISRVVVHPCWRGMGLAVRLVRAALSQPTTPYTEALAAMGRVNPFFERAGMTAYQRPPLPTDLRLIEALESVGISPFDLGAPRLVLNRVESLSAPHRNLAFNELYRWYRQNGGRHAKHSTDPAIHLQSALEKLTLEPVYYLHQNRYSYESTNNPA